MGSRTSITPTFFYFCFTDKRTSNSETKTIQQNLILLVFIRILYKNKLSFHFSMLRKKLNHVFSQYGILFFVISTTQYVFEILEEMRKHK